MLASAGALGFPLCLEMDTTFLTNSVVSNRRDRSSIWWSAAEARPACSFRSS